ncbi:MAG: flagellar basal body P-ring formation chaperone FlgA [Pseudomonadota bacterium]
MRVLLALALLVAFPAQAETVLARRAIPPNTSIAASDLALAPGDIAGAARDISDVIGRESGVAIYPGHPVMLEHLRQPALIERNDTIELRYTKGPLTILTEGRALRRGHFGSRIPVLNLGSKSTVSGIVTHDGAVEVGR